MAGRSGVTVAKPRFFASQAAWRTWLEKNHAGTAALLVGFHKAATGHGGLTYQQALDEALAFGWIDGRRFGGEDSWSIRFSQRQPRSIWSAVNIRRVGELTAAGRMHKAGLAAFAARSEERQNRYSHENQEVAFAAEYEAAFRANSKAWTWFAAMPPSYRRPATWWVMSAKKPETRERRLATLIADSAAGRRVKPLTPPGGTR
jgi:uncharacterized protein YdeI (YjbR/CyaY-like superfamily)